MLCWTYSRVFWLSLALPAPYVEPWSSPVDIPGLPLRGLLRCFSLTIPPDSTCGDPPSGALCEGPPST